jgi:hypothetical protein
MSTPHLRGAILAIALAVPLSALPPAAQSAAPAPTERAAAARTSPTPYALTARGFGSRVSGGEVPVESDTTAFQRIGCTNRAGLTKEISEAAVEVPGLGLVEGVVTTLRTTRANGTVASTSVQRVAKVTLAETPLGTLTLEGLRAKTRAFHDDAGFHAIAQTEVGRIVLTPAVGDPVVQDLPSANQPLEIPGVATISVGPRKTNETAQGSFAQATTLIVDSELSGTRALLGLARAKMNSGVQELLFRGGSSGIRAQAVEGLLTKKRTPLTLMPCQGTRGELQTKSLAAVDLTDAIEAGALNSAQRTTQTRKRTKAFERGSVAGFDLGGGALVIDGVVAQANMIKPRGEKIRFNARGTTIGQITADGEPQTFPDTGVLEIPDVARLEAKVTKRTDQTLSVVGLRITLLDGIGAVIDLGTATIGGRRSGL